jgi:hypothetical protein
MPNVQRGNRGPRSASVAVQRDTTREGHTEGLTQRILGRLRLVTDIEGLLLQPSRAGGASQVFVVDEQHPCKAASMMDAYAPTPGADAKDGLEDSSWL